MSRDFWNERYRRYELEWGLEPNKTCLVAAEILPPGAEILDLSCGYGRDSLYLSRRGYQLTGLDLSQVAIERATDLAARENLLINFIRADFGEWDAQGKSFDAVLVFNLLQMFDQPARQAFIDKMTALLKSGGLLILAAFSTEDPDYGRGTMVEDDTFKNEQGRLRHFYDRREMEEAFSALKIMRLEEFSLSEHDHGYRKPHEHREWLIVAQNFHNGPSVTPS
ncbi:MAG: class I SAM-dependent methyltransferase [bacterium]